MSDKPLYYRQSTPKTIHPAKILPSLLQKQQQRKAQQAQSQKIYANIFEPQCEQKQKKIKKDDRKNYRTKMCPKGRQCKHRFTCRFAHTEQELRKPFLKRKNPCILYQRGQCSLGSACRDYHGNIDLQKNYKYKEKVCEDYAKGKCQKGNIYPKEKEGMDQYVESGSDQQRQEQIQKQIEGHQPQNGPRQQIKEQKSKQDHPDSPKKEAQQAEPQPQEQIPDEPMILQFL